MKLEEITKKERFINQLKDPKLEEMRSGLEKLSKIFNDKGWDFRTSVDGSNERYWIHIVPKTIPYGRAQNDELVDHIATMEKIFPNKFIFRHPQEEDGNTFVYSINIYDDFPIEKQ